jgi:purine-binding chemotaxis protein CheW
METIPPADSLRNRDEIGSMDADGGRQSEGEHTPEKPVDLRFGYRAGGVGFLVRRGIASEVLSAPPVFPFPRMPAALLGFVNLRGVIVPVLDLAGLVTGNMGNVGGRFMIVLDGGGGAVAIPIDNLPVTLNQLVPAAGVMSCPPRLQGFLRGVMLDGCQHWHELDHRGLMHQAVSA